MQRAVQAVREAARSGDFGRVVRLAREEAGLSQCRLGQLCGISQSAVSRLEARGPGASYDMTHLARMATHLQIPPRLVGLADQITAGTSVERRRFFTSTLAAAATPAIPVPRTPSTRNGHVETGQTATLRVATSAYRRMDGTTASRHLSEPVLAHLRLAQTVAADTTDSTQRARLAEVGSEAASLAGWLAWDMGDHGSARTWYGSAIKAARSSGNRLLGPV